MTRPALLLFGFWALWWLAEPAAHKAADSSLAEWPGRVVDAMLGPFEGALDWLTTNAPPAPSGSAATASDVDTRTVYKPAVSGHERTGRHAVDPAGAQIDEATGHAERKLQDFLRRKCAACHGGVKRSVVPGLDVLDLDSLEKSKYLVRGNSYQSPIRQRVSKGDMPPHHLRPPSEGEKGDLAKWIDILPPKRPPSIVEFCRTDSRLSFLLEAAEAAGLTEDLSAGGPYTILAPTNEAFDRLLASAGNRGTLLDEKNRDKLLRLLLNHGVTGRRTAEELERAGRLTTLHRFDLMVKRSEGKLYVSEAVVITPDIVCSKGVIHVIDRVLIPFGLELFEKPPIITSALGIELVVLSGGEFTMGSAPAGDPRRQNEGPQHKVRVSPFLLGKCEVTRGLYFEIMNWDPAYDPPFHPRKQWPERQTLPVQHVTWIDAVKFCNTLSQAEEYALYYKIDLFGDREVVTVPDPGGNGYRLPYEAEWEYACRAGGDGEYSFGDHEATLDEYAWHRGNLAEWGPQPVGKKRSNAWGLHDMHGNVQEWCYDWHGPYQEWEGPRPLVDRQGPAEGTEKVYRGGSYFRPPEDCRSAYRTGGPVTGRKEADFRHASIGFRVARTPERGQPEWPPPDRATGQKVDQH